MLTGARAARADLARLKRGKQADAACLEAAGAFFRSAESAFGTLRSYEADHPAVERTLERLMTALNDYCEQYGDLVFELEPTEILVFDSPVYTVRKPQENLWYPFYTSGVREVTLQSTMTRPDMKAFADVANRFRNFREEDYGEDDVVTALWSLDLRSVQVASAPCYVEDAEISSKALAAIAALHGAAIDATPRSQEFAKPRRRTDEDVTELLGVLRRQEVVAIDVVPAPTAATRRLLELDEPGRRRLLSGLHQARNLDARYTETLLNSLGDESDGEIDGEELLAGEIRGTADRDDFGLLARILDGLSHRRDLISKALDRHVVARLLDTFVETPSSEVELQIIASLVHGSVHVKAMLEAAQKCDSLRKRRLLLSCVSQFGAPTAVVARHLIADAERSFAESLIGVLSEIGGGEADEALEQALNHDFYRIRGLAYQALLRGEDPARDVERIRRAVSDSNSLVRQCGLEFLSASGNRVAADWLKTKIDSNWFAEYELPEKKRFYSAYVSVVGGDALPWLEAKLAKKGLTFFNTPDDERIAAISAVVELRADGAEALLQKVASTWIVMPRVRQAAKRALEALKKPARPQDPRRKTFTVSWTPEPTGGLADPFDETGDGSSLLDQTEEVVGQAPHGDGEGDLALDATQEAPAESDDTVADMQAPPHQEAPSTPLSEAASASSDGLDLPSEGAFALEATGVDDDDRTEELSPEEQSADNIETVELSSELARRADVVETVELVRGEADAAETVELLTAAAKQAVEASSLHTTEDIQRPTERAAVAAEDIGEGSGGHPVEEPAADGAAPEPRGERSQEEILRQAMMGAKRRKTRETVQVYGTRNLGPSEMPVASRRPKRKRRMSSKGPYSSTKIHTPAPKPAAGKRPKLARAARETRPVCSDEGNASYSFSRKKGDKGDDR